MATTEKVQVLAVVDQEGTRSDGTVWKSRNLQCFTGSVVGSIACFDEKIELSPGSYMIETDWRAGDRGRLEKVVTKITPANPQPQAKPQA